MGRYIGLITTSAVLSACAPTPAPPAQPQAPKAVPVSTDGPRMRGRELGIVIGTLPVGPFNAITDVPGVLVGHTMVTTEKTSDGRGPARTGATVILPTSDDFWHSKVPAGFFSLNGNGEMTGIHYLREFGVLE